MKILVTEKNEVIRNLILHILQKKVMILSWLLTEKKHLRFLSEEKFDIIITNIHSTILFWLELITYIKSKDHLKDTKIVILSDNFTPENIFKTLQNGNR